MRVVVIGSTGHIGTWLVPRLVRSGHEVIAVSRGTRRPYHESNEWNEVMRVTMDRSSMEETGAFGPAIATMRGDVVIDLICFTEASALHMIDSLKEQVDHFIHCGSLWVHGIPRSRPYSETAQRQPIGDYGIRKNRIERLLLDASETGFPATVLHPGHITGPGWIPINPAGNLDVEVFARLARGETIVLPDDGTATLQHVHADDVALAFALAVGNREKSVGQAFHVAAELPVTMRSYAETAAGWFEREANIEYLPWEEWKTTVSARDAEITSDHIVHSPFASIEKATRRLGFMPGFSAVEAAYDAVKWLEANQPFYSREARESVR